MRSTKLHGDVPLRALHAASYTVPTDRPESDGTLAWNDTTIVVVTAEAGGHTGLGYTYGHEASAVIVRDVLAGALRGHDAMAVAAAWHTTLHAIRNLGRPGIVAMAISAVDAALWDLKARVLDVPLVTLLGATRADVPVYGSGGFTSYTVAELQAQLGGWAAGGIRRVKMKIGRDPSRDVERVRAARQAIGDGVELFVDANGAHDRSHALAAALAFAEQDVRWFEEPVSSDDLDGLRFLRDRAPAGMAIAAGEYGYDTFYFRRMLQAGAVDILQADGTRCLGVTGFMAAARRNPVMPRHRVTSA